MTSPATVVVVALRPFAEVGMVWYGMVWYGMVWYGMVWHGMVWYGMVWYGMVWHVMDMVRVWYGYGTARHGMIQ